MLLPLNCLFVFYFHDEFALSLIVLHELFSGTVHKQRDIVPLDINDEVEESDDDDELPVLDLKVLVFFFWITR